MSDEQIIDEEAVFSAAIAIDEADRQLAYLRQACGGDAALLARMQALLKVHASENSAIEQAAHSLQLTIDVPGVVEGPGTVIGRYKLLEKIGEGGFGVVYMAEQEDPVRRRVALKIIKLGMDTQKVIARFEAERQALALMDHPNIAKVLDGGADRDRPALLRHGAGPGRPDHRLLRPEPADHARAAGAVHPGLPRRPARAPERHHPPRHQAVERPGHAARRRAGAQGHRLRHRQGDQTAAHREDAVHPLRADDRHAGLHEPGAGRDERAGHRHAHATSTRWACCCTSC